MAWRTSRHFWDRERTVVLTYNHLADAKQKYKIENQLDRLQDGLFEMRSKVRAGQKHWTN